MREHTTTTPEYSGFPAAGIGAVIVPLEMLWASFELGGNQFRVLFMCYWLDNFHPNEPIEWDWVSHMLQIEPERLNDIVTDLVAEGFFVETEHGIHIRWVETAPSEERIIYRYPDRVTRGKEWLALRRAVLARDGNACRYCGSTDGVMHIDHIVPVSGGGDDAIDNLVTACRACNVSKGAKQLEAWRR